MGEGEAWQLEAELRIGAMGYDEGYVSIVDARKFKSVSVCLLSLVEFCQIQN